LDLLVLASAFAQSLTGTVTDEKGDPLPFTTIYVLNTSSGGSTNEQGLYEMTLEPGLYDVVFQYVGYKRVVKEIIITAGASKVVDVQLHPELIRLKEVVINSKDRDPAYAVIREAMRKRKYHLDELSAYTCRVYIKGNQHIDKAPGRVFGFNVPIDTGIIYLSESVSDLAFIRPDKYSERMISSKVSGQNNAFSFNMASEMIVNFYENLLQVEGLTERGFVSPIASNAFFYYDYKLRSAYQEGEYLINKIEVIPRRKNDPVLAGFIYIVEDSWRIHSVDLMIAQKKQIDFVDSLRLKQVYAPLDYGVWVLLSQRFDFRIAAFGFEGNGYFVGVYSDYQIEPRYKLAAVDKLKGPTATQVDTLKKNERKLLAQPKKNFGREVLIIEENANKREDVYWETMRPVPLTPFEKKDYRIKDSLLIVKESKPFKDSIDQKRNNLSLSKIFVTGYNYQQSYHKRFLSFDPLYKIVQYNTVEGFVTNLNMSYTRYFDDNRFYRITPTARYGFSSERFYGKLRANYYFDPKTFSSAQVEFGNFITQFSDQDPITPLVNSFETLVRGRNLMKLYEKTFIHTRFRKEVLNGVLLSARFHWENRSSLYNTSEISIAKGEDREFTSNVPINRERINTQFPTHQASILDLSVIYHPGQRYISRPDQKVLLINKWPSFTFSYLQGIGGFLGSDINYNKLSVKMTDDLTLGLLGVGEVFLETGVFPSADRMYFMDFQHFNGNGAFLVRFDPGNFQLLDYYLFSTNKSYFKGQYEHHFNGFITNKIPLVRKTKVQMVATVNYLHTPYLKHYAELGFGLEHILKVGRLDFFTSYEAGSYRAFRIRLGLGF